MMKIMLGKFQFCFPYINQLQIRKPLLPPMTLGRSGGGFLARDLPLEVCRCPESVLRNPRGRATASMCLPALTRDINQLPP